MAIRLDKAFGGGADTWYPASSHLRFGAGDENSKPNQGRKSFAGNSIVNRKDLRLAEAIEHNCF